IGQRDPNKLRIRGHVRDAEGNPVQGVRVHNGASGERRPSRDLVQSWTDSSGAYTLAGLSPGKQAVSTFHPDYISTRRDPADLGDADLHGFRLQVTAVPQVNIAAPLEIPEKAGLTNLFTFTRTGPTTD